ncbi:MAG: hypothetical protein J0M25_00570 [Flavobacteriales bacterium]|nr:hypothetical protein [Flavobacteriales bacterium]
MLYFIFDNFDLKINLENLNPTFNEENDFFSNEFQNDMTFPVKIPLKNFISIADYSVNSLSAKKSYPGKLYMDGRIIFSTLKIQRTEGQFLEAVIFFGLENFPGFSNKLSQLDLYYEDGINDMKAHALEIITKAYPEVDYNFPMVHTKKYDPTSNEYNGFLGIINNFSEGIFIENILNEESNIDDIRNIMQPAPYLLHVMKKAVEFAGKELAGDVLELPDLQKALIFRHGDYFTSLKKEDIPLRIKNNEWSEETYFKNGIQHVRYTKDFVVEKKGDYILYGSFYNCVIKGAIFSGAVLNLTDISASIKKVSSITTNLFSYEVNGSVVVEINQFPKMVKRDIDIELSFEAGDIIRFEITEVKRNTVPPLLQDYPEVVSMTLFPVRFRNPDGSPIISLLDLNEIDLKRVVPDVTVSDLFNAVRAFKNLGFVVTDTQVIMNFIKPQFNRSTAVDLSEFDVEFPLRNFNQERTYELSYKDGKNEAYPVPSLYVTSEGQFDENYTTQDTTKKIEIGLLPLPIDIINNIATAVAFDDDNSKINLVFFDPFDEDDLSELKPVTFFNPATTIEFIHQNYYKEMIYFLINSETYEHSFIIPVEKFKDVTVQSLVFHHKNFHVFQSLERERLLIGTNQYWRITMKTESLPLIADPSA